MTGMRLRGCLSVTSIEGSGRVWACVIVRSPSGLVERRYGQRSGEDGGFDDAPEPFEGFGAALDLHPHQGSLPGGEEEVGEVERLHGEADVSGVRRLPQAVGEGLAPDAEDLGEPGTDGFAVLRGLQAQVADEAAVAPVARLHAPGDGLEVGP